MSVRCYLLHFPSQKEQPGYPLSLEEFDKRIDEFERQGFTLSEPPARCFRQFDRAILLWLGDEENGPSIFAPDLYVSLVLHDYMMPIDPAQLRYL